jgi:hypothetical protein
MIENIARVTAYLRGVIEKEGGNPERETLTLVKTTDGKDYHTDADGDFWRVYLFIEDTISCDLPDTPELFALSGAAFGRFQQQLEGFDARELYESVRDFHNTPARYGQLMEAVRNNAAGRLGEVGPELSFCMGYGEEVHTLLRALAAGEIPLRVTHNDTKLNNILMDQESGKARAIIDLIDSPYLQIYTDTGNVACNDMDPVPDLVYGGKHLIASHIKDATLGVCRDVPFGEGIVDFDACFRAFRALDFHGMFIAEMWSYEKEEFIPYLSTAVEFIRGKIKAANQD